MKYCLIFSCDNFTIVLRLNILWLKAVNEITARQTLTSLCKHDVIKVCSIEYLTTQIESVLPTFFQILDRSQNYRIFNVRVLSTLWNIYHSTTAFFFDPPCRSNGRMWSVRCGDIALQQTQSQDSRIVCLLSVFVLFLVYLCPHLFLQIKLVIHSVSDVWWLKDDKKTK